MSCPPPPSMSPPLINSYCTIVTQERRKVDGRNYALRHGRPKTAQTLAIEAKYSTNKGLSVWLFTALFFVNKNLSNN